MNKRTFLPKIVNLRELKNLIENDELEDFIIKGDEDMARQASEQGVEE
jgi:hypothetical protein